MSRGFKMAVALIGASVLLVAVIAMLPQRKRSARLDRYLCDRCAMQREVISKWWLGIPVRGSDKIVATSLSREMAAGENARCEHTWIRIYFDHHGTQVMGHGGVNSRFAIQFLTDDDTGAAGLVKYSRATDRRPEIVWHTLFHHLAEFPRGETTGFETWLFEGNVGDSGAIAAWLRENYDSLQTKRK
jgi:hypothetical protein